MTSELEVNHRDLFTKTIDMQGASMRGDPLRKLANQTLPTPGQLFDGHVNAPASAATMQSLWKNVLSRSVAGSESQSKSCVSLYCR